MTIAISTSWSKAETVEDCCPTTMFSKVFKKTGYKSNMARALRAELVVVVLLVVVVVVATGGMGKG